MARQQWRDVAFVHFRYPQEVVQPLLPDGLRCDVLDGTAWVSLSVFCVVDARFAVAPFAATFPEVNLRTYVRDRRGVDGIWFLSLDVDNVSNVYGGRVLGLRYHWSSVEIVGRDPLHYRSRRRTGPAADLDLSLTPGSPLDGVPDLDAQLVGRWRAFSVLGGRVLTIPVEHEPWPLRRAALEQLDESMTRAAGLPAPAESPFAHWSAGVDARLGPPKLHFAA